MQKKNGTQRESRGIIMNKIHEHVTRLETKLMDFKILRKCRKEEAPIGVIEVGNSGVNVVNLHFVLHPNSNLVIYAYRCG
jgi:hypothetical protein